MKDESVFESEIFEKCSLINDYLCKHQEKKAREELIKLLDFHKRKGIEHYSELVNHLIREVGLFPYMDAASADWQDAFAYEMFKVDVGLNERKPLHLQQSQLLKKLLEGKNIAVSAPTSFGKSFVVDAFISLKRPNNVVLIVPTIALMDETRRRLYKKFSKEYEIITTADAKLQEKNIFIFPQERALSYADLISDIDILIIDEFYKASVAFEKDRAITLLKCISVFSPKAKQRYYLAPNISELATGPFLEGMEFIPLDFNTVFLNVENKYPEISQNQAIKYDVLKNILEEKKGKTLIYAGTYTEIDHLKTFFLDQHVVNSEKNLLSTFSEWLKKNYDDGWYLPKLIQKGIGVHNGQLHRSLAQIQIQLFERLDGLDYLISTSSIIEGVNTSAENVVVWKSMNGPSRLNYFTYKNIVGRCGRMLRHFVGNVFLLDKTPNEEDVQLALNLPADAVINEKTFENINFSEEEKNRIQQSARELEDYIGNDAYASICAEFGSFDLKRSGLKDLVKRMYEKKWISGLANLNSENVEEWKKPLKDLLFLQRAHWNVPSYDNVIDFIVICSNNWGKPLSEILQLLGDIDINVNQFFELERSLMYNFANFLNIFNKIQKNAFEHFVDISPFIAKLKNLFLPPTILSLEEFGLPRMLCQKIQQSGLIDFENQEKDVKMIVQEFLNIGRETVKSLKIIDSFDKVVIDYFYDGIEN